MIGDPTQPTDGLAHDVLLETRNVRKTFPGVVALDDVSIDVRRGEILGLVGENGAGKSTLTKIIAGQYLPDAGDLVWDGRVVSHTSTAHAVRLGIEMVPQELALARSRADGRREHVHRALSRALRKGALAHDVALGPVDRRAPRIDGGLAKARRDAFSPADQRLVMVGRALVRDVRLLIMDEPTASLPEDEVVLLLGVLRKLREDGVTIIYISHRLGDPGAHRPHDGDEGLACDGDPSDRNARQT